ncbi:hypothetical protein [uncultured Halomonas sp.]|uniref:hypothetical protein n=1 Tax=uncultured Halomonas sp. TaxID=173971 RepID=UPI0026143921|nr:hypothetical protein [uncultured Halomonas sp.]
MRGIILLALLCLVPLAAEAQMKCPDGSYRHSCPGGGGQGVSGNLSTYEGPSPQALPPLRFNTRGSQDSRRYRSAGEATRSSQSLDGPRSTHQRARAAGLSRNELVRARNRGQLLVGMSRRDVDHIMGSPDDVNTYVNSGRRCDNLWYRDSRRGWHTRITMCNGKLTSYGADSR